MKKISLLFVCFLLSLSLHAQQERPATKMMSLEDCIDYAFGNSYNRNSVKLNEQSQQITYDQSKLERLPDLSASASQGGSNSKGSGSSWDGSYGANTSVVLYQGGQRNQTIRKNKLGYEQTTLKTEQYDNELTIQILQSFLSTLGNEELLKYQNSVLATSKEQAKQGKARYAAGDILESDYLILEAQLAADNNNVVETTINHNNNLLALKNLMSMDLDQELQLIYPDTLAIATMSAIPKVGYVVDRALETLPDIRISDYTVQIAQKGVDISKSGYYPTLSMNGSLGTGATNFDGYGDQLSDRFKQSGGISLSVPIFSKGRNRASVAQSNIALQQAELGRKQTEVDTRQTLLKEYGNVESALSKYEASKIKELAYQKSFEAYRAKFNSGSITTVEFLQQQNNYIGAINEYIQSKYGFILKRKILDVYMCLPITM